MRLSICGVALLLAASGAAAQPQICTRSGSAVICQPEPGSGAADAAMANASANAAAAAGHGYVSPNGNGPGVIGFIGDLRQASRRKRVGALVAAGKCDEARAVALKAGDLALADEVLHACAGPAG